MKKLITLPTEEKLGRIADLVKDVIRKRCGISDRGAQNLIERGGDFQTALVPIICQMAREGNPYAIEQVRISCSYSEDYIIPSIAEQILYLKTAFSGLNLTGAEAIAKQIMAPKTSNGSRIIPKLSALGRIFGIVDPYGSGYGQLVQKVLDAIAQTRKFNNYRKDKLNEENIRLNAEVRIRLEKLEAADQNDFLVLAINFGDWKTGFTYSPRNARWQALNVNRQLPLGSAQIGCLLIADPGRLIACNELSIDCPADEYCWHVPGEWLDCLCFYFDNSSLVLSAGNAGSATICYGSVVAFLEA